MARHRLYNLIEHIRATENRYLFMDEVTGTAQSRSHLVPDSPDWFAWLAGLGSFHFKGKCGHFTARQERKQRGASYWYAYRKAHQHRHKRYLGTTDKLTLDHLERTARALHEEALGAIPEDEALNAHVANPLRPPQERKGAVVRSILDCGLEETGREARGGPVSWSRRSGPHAVLPADRNPCPLSACQPSAAAPLRVPSVRAGLHAPLPVKAAERSGAPAGLGLDREWYTGCARTGGSILTAL